MSTVDEDVSFAQSGDDGEETDLSIQPIGYSGASEFNDPSVFNRVYQNLRRRTEVLRSEVRDLKYLSDYDRGVIFSTSGTIEFETVGPNYQLVMSGDLTVSPALAPGYRSGGRALGSRLFIGQNAFAGTLGVNDISLVASGDYTGQRGYADGKNLATAGVLSLGGNFITVELVGENRAGGAGSIQATVTGTPRRHVRITYGTQAPGVTVAQLISAINNDTTLFGTEGSFGLRHILFASTTSGGASTTLPDFSRTKLKGGYDSEAHMVTAVQMAAFFAVAENQLREGEGLAIGYPAGLVEEGAETFGGGVWSYLGGRRQSLVDAPTDRVGGVTPNVGGSATYGNLFNTARQPELIPGSIPIGRMVGNDFIFVDGTRLTVGDPALYIGENYVTLARIALFSASGGAALVGYNGAPAYNADAAATTSPQLPADNLEDTLDQLVTDLAEDATSESGARRVGVEALTGTPSLENNDHIPTVPQGSLREAVSALLGDGSYLNGLSYRVHEGGHTLKGAAPLRKNFSGVGMPATGAEMLRAEMHTMPNVTATPALGVNEHAFTVLVPFSWNVAGDDALGATESVEHDVSSVQSITITAVGAARYANIKKRFPVPASIDGSPVLTPVVVVKLTGVSGAADAEDGLYYITGFNNATQGFFFRRFGTYTDVPDFTGMAPGATATFYNTLIIGNDTGGTRVKMYHYNGDRSAIVVGLGDMYTPFLQLDYNDGTDPRVMGTRMFGNRAMWSSLRRINGGAETRNTENILSADDKELLDGMETGAPVNANASHHHGFLLQEHLWWTTLQTPETWDGGAWVSTGNIYYSNVTVPLGLEDALNVPQRVQMRSPMLASLPAARYMHAVILQVSGRINALVGGASGDEVGFQVRLDSDDHGAAVYRRGGEVRLSTFRTGAGEPASPYVMTYQIIVPVDQFGKYTLLSAGRTSNFELSNSGLEIREVGAVVSRAPVTSGTLW